MELLINLSVSWLIGLMFYLIIYISVDDAAGMTGYLMQNGGITGEWCIRKDLKEAVVA